MLKLGTSAGNSFVEDDNGRLFYVKGCVNERPAVCDDDKPLMTTTIRRELPAMEDVEFERLDQLSRGKLRHFLLGSPSGEFSYSALIGAIRYRWCLGYSWNEQVETILAFEQRWKEWESKHTDPKMLPSYLRPYLDSEGKLIEDGKNPEDQAHPLPPGDPTQKLAGATPS